MPRELITVSVGQAGNQIGHRFWELAVKEHAAFNTDGLFTESMSRWEPCEGTNLAWQCRQELLQEERLQDQIPLAPALHATLSCEDPRTCRSCYTSPVVHEHLAPPSLPPSRSFFRNVDGGADLPLTAPGKAGERRPLPINDLRARAVLVDMASGGRAGCIVCNR